ncbi:transporter substrate-binding domain-containing protein [Mesorhizobium sp.]|uniref:transporter substrate-binding domain-containing protein n=2 Tax=Mesorhizobium sp. TaxID=1871066 RepID=UPI0025C336D0|nr:transporter substrate-binding domain-containing protein [Mesorhizobium sp.]
MVVASMKNFSSILLSIGIFLVSQSGNQALAQDAEWKEIRIATEGAYPPFNFVDAAGKLQGLDVDIAMALCEEMKAKCTVVAQDWDGIIPGLLARKFDAIVASMSITQERLKVIDFSKKYYSSKLSILTKADSQLADIKPESFEGKTIGAQSSTPQAEYAQEIYGKHGATVKLYPSQTEADMDLSNGRLDAIVADKFYLAAWMESTGAGCCKLLGDLAEGRTEIGVGLRKEDVALKEKFDAAMEAIIANGVYKKTVARYFNFDIY